MGPGYFPILLGVIMCLLGLGLFVTATEDPPVGDSGIRVALRGPVLIIMAILAFALTVQPLGLVPSVFVAVFLSSQASRGIRVLDTLILAAVTTAVTFLIFRVGLGLQIEAFGS
jgi:hypothetical protein